MALINHGVVLLFSVGQIGSASETGDEFQNSPMPSNEAIGKLTYTVCTLKEALRKYSLVPVVTRNALDDDKIGNINIPAGTKIFINAKVCTSAKLSGSP
jgi:cytochrome P450